MNLLFALIVTSFPVDSYENFENLQEVPDEVLLEKYEEGNLLDKLTELQERYASVSEGWLYYEQSAVFKELQRRGLEAHVSEFEKLKNCKFYEITSKRRSWEFVEMEAEVLKTEVIPEFRSLKNCLHDALKGALEEPLQKEVKSIGLALEVIGQWVQMLDRRAAFIELR